MKVIIALFATALFAATTVEAQLIYQAPVGPYHYYRAPRAAVDIDSGRVQRQAGGDHHHDVTDFGAHTGHHGAFGWYADFPVHAQGH